MKWNKIRKELKERLAEDFIGHIDYHLTTYKNSTGYIGRAWLTWDGEEIVNFSNQDTWIVNNSYSNESAGTQYISHEAIPSSNRKEGELVEKGEFSKYDFAENAFRFINMKVHDAMNSENPILNLLAIMDKGIGKRKLIDIAYKDRDDLHPLVLHFLNLRLKKYN